LQPGASARERKDGKFGFSDEKCEEILRFIDSLDERVFSAAAKNTGSCGYSSNHRR
jgi:hypothetical protein